MNPWRLGCRLYYSQGFKQGTDWDWAPAPGTKGNFIMLSDSFGLAKNAPNRDNVIKWLALCASKEGQDAFNPIKGSIPSRIDGDRSKYDAYLNAAMDDFATNAIVPVLHTALAISEPWLTRINDIMSVFTTELNVDKAMKEFQAASDRLRPQELGYLFLTRIQWLRAFRNPLIYQEKRHYVLSKKRMSVWR